MEEDKQQKLKLQLNPNNSKFQKFTLYETSQMFYLIASDHSSKAYSIIKINRSKPDELDVFIDPNVYNSRQMSEILNSLHSVKASNIKKTIAYGLLGFIKFTECYYMMLITKRKEVAKIGANSIYEIEETAFKPIYEKTGFGFPFSFSKSDEAKYKEIFRSVDLTKNFYFSYNYDLTQTLQMNMMEDDLKKKDSNEQFIWNDYLIDGAMNSSIPRQYLIPIVHGSISQKTINLHGKKVSLVLIGRRSRYFAGTRYLKRGINDHGHVANFVEIEQIVFDSDNLLNQQKNGNFSSYVQIRGSIPIFWYQKINTIEPKPDIELGKYDPVFNASKLHFNTLFARYGYPVICLDLIKQHEKKPRESKLSSKFQECIDFLNKYLPKEKKIDLIQWDFKAHFSENRQTFLDYMDYFSERIDSTDFFSSTLKNKYNLQKGILRTNCIDCLDRTNLAQFYIGNDVLSKQLHALNLINDPNDVDIERFTATLNELYQELGDRISMQYGGSQMVSAGIHNRGGLKDVITNVTRYYSNNFKDENKQNAINLLLGNYVPSKEKEKLWNLDSDYYLHTTEMTELNNDFKSIMNPLDRPVSRMSIEVNPLNIIKSQDNTHVTDKILKSIQSPRQTFFEETYNQYILDSFLTDEILSKDSWKNQFQNNVGKKSENLMFKPFLLDEEEMNDNLKEYMATKGKDLTNEIYGINFDKSNENINLYEDYVNQKTDTKRFLSKKEEFLTYQKFIDEPIKDVNENMELYEKYFKPSIFKVDEIKNLIDESMTSFDFKESQNDIEGSTFQMLRNCFSEIKNDKELLENLDEILVKMKKEVSISNRVRHILRKDSSNMLEVLKGDVLEKCFLGFDAIDWILSKKIFQTRKNATFFFNVLVSGQILTNVVFESQFYDGPNLYRFTSDDPLKVLNLDISMSRKNVTNKHPCDLSMEMMEEIKNVLNKFGPISGKNYFTTEYDYKQFSGSPEYLKFLKLCAELQEVDLSILKQSERGQFFVNIFNCLFIHGVLEIYHGNIHQKVRLSFYRTTCYRIGIFLFSLHDIKHGILRSNKRPHGGIKKPFENNDPRINFKLQKSDGRVHFVLSQSTAPYLSIVNHGNFEYDLQASAKLFYVNNIQTQGGGIDDKNEVIEKMKIY
eukprot:gene9018-1117_t